MRERGEEKKGKNCERPKRGKRAKKSRRQRGGRRKKGRTEGPMGSMNENREGT